jgi:aspartyl-tRNA(Asn)/glutamyl-tRNA(Gln) amidotransferase subunit A
MAGFPGLSVPIGLDHDGLPIGMLTTARAFDEPAVLRAGHRYQAVTDHHLLRPQVPIATVSE